MITATALLVSAFLPFVCASWSSRGLLTRLDDPLLPDRLLAHSRRVGTAAGIAIAVGALLAPWYIPAVVLLAWVSSLAGSFRARRSVFDETWGFLSYLDHTLRFWIGLLGSFALIAAIPWAMAVAGRYGLAVGIAVGVVAWLWILVAPSVFRRLVRARALTDPEAEELSPHFSRVLESASCRAPALYVAEARGGVWVNAFALPAVGRPGVLFTRGFLDAMSPREIAAIFAHEVAHLEHFQPQKVARGRALAVLLSALPIFLWAGPASPFLRGWEWIWPTAFLVAMTLKTARSRGHEAESDRRAVALSSDPEALVSALTKLHALNRISRRWDAAFESVSTHPSLARRIRAIRALSGEKSPDLAPTVFRASGAADRAVVFDDARVHFLEGVPQDDPSVLAGSAKRRSYRYQDVHELRLRANRELWMKSASGDTARIAIRAEDVQAVEEVLDRVDGLLGEPPSGAESPTARLWCLVLGLLAIIPSVSWVTVALAAAAFARPGFATLLGLGASALASALWIPEPWWRSASLALAGIAALVIAVRKRRLARNPRELLLAALTPIGLAILSTLGAARALASTLPMMYASLWASDHPSAFVGLAAGGVVLLFVPRAGARLGSALALSASLGLALLGSSAFRERFGDDLFVSSGSPIPIDEASLTALREVRIPGYVSRISLSPDGASFAVTLVTAVESEEEKDAAYLVESAPGRLEPVRALALELLDRERILFVEREEGRAFLKLGARSDLESAGVVRELPLLAGIDLDSDASGHWMVSGYDWVEGSRVLLRGGLDSAGSEEIRFSTEEESTMVASSGDAALAAKYDFSALPFLPLFSSPRLVMALEVETGGGTRTNLGASLLMPQCFAAPLTEPGFYCTVDYGKRTGLFFLPPSQPSFESLGFVPGTFHANEAAAGGWLLLNRFDGPPLLFARSRGLALRLDAQVGSLALSNGVLATARADHEDDETVVSLYTVRQ